MPSDSTVWTCGCGNLKFTFVTDYNTGSVYQQCERCKNLVNSSPEGWIDRKMGLALDSDNILGSWCTISVASGFVQDSRGTDDEA